MISEPLKRILSTSYSMNMMNWAELRIVFSTLKHQNEPARGLSLLNVILVSLKMEDSRKFVNALPYR